MKVVARLDCNHFAIYREPWLSGIGNAWEYCDTCGHSEKVVTEYYPRWWLHCSDCEIARPIGLNGYRAKNLAGQHKTLGHRASARWYADLPDDAQRWLLARATPQNWAPESLAPPF